jgi:hypothetical protein
MKADITHAVVVIVDSTRLFHQDTTCAPNDPALPNGDRILATNISKAYETLGDLTSCDQFYQLADDWDPDNRELEEAV